MEDECNGKWDIDRLYCIAKLNKVNKINEFQTESLFTQVSTVFVLVLFLFVCLFFFLLEICIWFDDSCRLCGQVFM